MYRIWHAKVYRAFLGPVYKGLITRLRRNAQKSMRVFIFVATLFGRQRICRKKCKILADRATLDPLAAI